MTYEEARQFDKQLAAKCVENPHRPVYTIVSLEKIAIENGPSFVDALQQGQKATIDCHIQEIRAHLDALVRYNNPYSNNDDPYPIGYQNIIQLDGTQEIIKSDRGICIFTPNAVYTTIDMCYAYRDAMYPFEQQWKREEQEAQNLQNIKEALSDSSFFKKKFKAFCDEHSIPYAHKKGLIGPKEELEKIAAKMIQKLEDLGIDYKTATSIKTEDYSAIIDTAKKVHEQIQREKELDRLKDVLDQALQSSKPFVAIYDMHGLDIDAAISGKAQDVVLSGQFYPLEHATPTEANVYCHSYCPSIHDVIALGNGACAVITDKAVFITPGNPSQIDLIQEIYKEHLEDCGKALCPYSGIMGVQYLLAEQNGCVDYLTEIRGIDGTTEGVEQQVANWLAQTSPDSANLYYVDTESVKAIDINGIDRPISFDQIIPGMQIYVPSEHVHSMGPSEFETAPQLLTVIDCDTHTNVPIIVTDKGIITTNDLTREIAIAHGLEQEHDSPGNR